MGYKFNPFTGNFDRILKQDDPSEVSLEYGEDISALKVVYAENGIVHVADKDNTSKIHAIGISLTATLDTEIGTVKLNGIVEDSLFSSYNVNDCLFLGNNGAILTSAPTTGHRVLLGYYLGDNKIKLDIKEIISLA